MAGWEIDVRLRGDGFLQVMSPAFKGQLSAGLTLSGTLEEPLAIGDISVDRGKVLFPFGQLTIDSGRVTLTEEDPFRPQIALSAQGWNFGYDISANLIGAADAPAFTLQSIPHLTARQILMMLTAGEIPRDDFGYGTRDKATKIGYYLGTGFVNRFLGNSSSSERLVIRSGEHITDEGKPTHSIEYRFDDRWSVFGEYNRFRDFNSGLRLKVLSR